MIGEQITYYADESMFHGFIPRIMGTRFDLVLIAVDRETALCCWQDVARLLQRLDHVFDRFNPDSEVSRVNAAAWKESVHVGPELREALTLCRNYFERSEGLFDVTLGHFSRVSLDGGDRVRFTSDEIKLDFGGFAKGYALRRIATYLKGAGIVSSFVDFGNSSIMGMGHHPYGTCWQVSLPDPVTGNPLRTFELNDLSLSTSGNTENYTGHIVNPQTGWHNEERMICTVTSPDPLDAEVASTVWMIATDEQRRRIVRNFERLEGFVFVC